MLIFGSTAAKFWFPDFRETKDLDIMSPEPKMSKEIQHYWQDAFSYAVRKNTHKIFLDPDFLYTIKVSHAAWDIHWAKTMKDIVFLKKKGCKLDPEFYELLYKEWEVVHRAKRVNLDVKNQEFFNKNVTRQYDHDWLHQFLAFGAEPMHNLIRLDPNSALCSKKLWQMLSHDDKVKCAMEEVYVIATERFISRGYPPRTSKMMSLKNLITSMTKGWFNLFLIENFDELVNFDNTHWLNKLKELKS
jgi:hypothetical protein